MNRMIATGCVAGYAAGVVSLAALVQAQEFEVQRSTIDSGGDLRSTGGGFELSGTIGQPDAGRMTGGLFVLTGGFWFPIAQGDCDEDGNVSLLDAGAFSDCMAGPSKTTPPLCRCFDVNRSGTVDLADFAAIQSAYTSG